ncbi:MAG: DUF4382 domain-containing protein [Gammaproteobacteria bacterium]|nr:MAG: DUF4382 domain-containing protein [Gammaproteobacteria bacterium]
MKRAGKFVAVVGSSLLISACGGGGSGPMEPATGLISIAITDAPVDEVTVVNVQFTGVTLKPASRDEIQIVFDAPKDFDLLTLTGGLTAELLPDTVVPVGGYNWVRLAVNAEFDNVFDSYAMTPTGQVELRVPGGSQSGLKLVSGFTVTQNRSTHLVVDWDLRKALSDPVGQPGLHLRPALRITDMALFGTLSGTVAEALVIDTSCSNDLAAQTGNAVYIYSGMTVTPGDIGDADNDPFMTATVTQDGAGTYTYEVNYLSVGDYTAAFTCQASDDDSVADDNIVFSAPQSFVIEDGVTTAVNF